MQRKDNSKPSMDKNNRRRGRPAGKNRVPLSLSERRARNAQYERERRIETAEAMTQLAEAARCDPQITNSELLATVITQFKNSASRNSSQSIEDLKRINDNLESQIAELQSRLGSDSDSQEIDHDEYSSEPISSEAGSDSDSEGKKNERTTKYRKISKEDTVHDSIKIGRKSSSFQSDLSSNSQDSIWSNHHFGKTLPSHKMPQSSPVGELDSDSASSHHKQRSESVSSGWRRDTPSVIEISSEGSYHSEVYSEQMTSQQNVNIEFRLIPEQQIVSEPSVDDEKNIILKDPFTDREKAILERMGWSDFINFQDIYSEGSIQSQLSWPLDYA